MSYEVLVVEDLPGLAEDYARLIERSTQLVTFGTDEPDKALEITSNNDIKVIVLDQKMPRMSGTELFKRLKELRPHVRAIMLTGQADASEVGEALTLGYDVYLHKSNVAQLPTQVEIQYGRYHAETAKSLGGKQMSLLHKEVRMRPRIYQETKYYLGDVFEVASSVIFEQEWRTLGTVNAGEEREERFQMELSRKVVHEESIASKLSAQFGLEAGQLAKVKQSIETKLEAQTKASETTTWKERVDTKRKLALPKESTKTDSVSVRSRHFQGAPEYRHVQFVIVQTCDACDVKQALTWGVYEPTGRIATRQVDYMSDGTERVTRTGFETQSSS